MDNLVLCFQLRARLRLALLFSVVPVFAAFVAVPLYQLQFYSVS